MRYGAYGLDLTSSVVNLLSTPEIRAALPANITSLLTPLPTLVVPPSGTPQVAKISPPVVQAGSFSSTTLVLGSLGALLYFLSQGKGRKGRRRR